MSDARATLAMQQPAAEWNAWRRSIDVFGDYRLSKVDLAKNDLRENDLTGRNLQNVILTEAEISGANLSRCDVSHSDLFMCRALSTNFSGCSLRGSRLSRAYLRNANFDGADLRGADLRRASMKFATMNRCDVRGVDLSSVRGLDQEQIVNALGDSRTRLPAHLIPPKAWLDFAPQRVRERLVDSDIPPEAPATIEAVVDGGIVRLVDDPGQARFAATMDPNALREEILSDIETVLPRLDNVVELRNALLRYREAVATEDFDIIILGVRGLKVAAVLDHIVREARDIETPGIAADMAGRMDAILLQHHLFVQQSHKWRSFMEEGSTLAKQIEDLQTIKQRANELANEMEVGALFDPALPRALKKVGAEIEGDTASAKLAAANVLLSIQNITQAMMSWVVREMRRFGQRTWDKFSETLSTAVGRGAAIGVVAWLLALSSSGLVDTYDRSLGWVKSAIRLVQQGMDKE